MRTLVTLAAALVASLALIAPAAADVPESAPPPLGVGHFDFTVEFPGDTNTCGFPLDETIQSKGSFRFWETPDGPFGNIFHNDVTGTFSANGRTVIVRQHITQEITTEVVERGLTIQIKLAGTGLVIRDAGVFVRTFDGAVTIVRGPHPVLEAGGESGAVAAICAALVS